jgi:hypothetical protein
MSRFQRIMNDIVNANIHSKVKLRNKIKYWN